MAVRFDLNAARERDWLRAQRQKHQARLEIVMRTYFENRAPSLGMEGLISDPDLNGSYRVNYGLELARRLLFTGERTGSTDRHQSFLDMVTGRFIAV